MFVLQTRKIAKALRNQLDLKRRKIWICSEVLGFWLFGLGENEAKPPRKSREGSVSGLLGSQILLTSESSRRHFRRQTEWVWRVN